ncbi:ABC transporter ATP-binding protein [Paenibacillus hexagrammi]|uniref:ATP-binding cassette domain-containing protein n=1 Tax=Paenibacillus hexagrammi TaxID=2908839 RepID=A0ABY3SPQ6_9BACL|nr:ATP-binding cassette domain-containing protein [Paenibacillus sp. YPD9-1]UJF35525.1 ATP-binding cassette domain-containing protein [Paenibacillus sp. YPD9-1]
MLIDVNNLSKQFTYHKKEPGLKSSVSNLFRRERLVKHAVKNITFSIDEGEIVGFLGPNGAGKTTTLKMLSGIMYPTSGEAKVAGYVPWERKKKLKQQFSIVMGQKSQLWWDLPAIESLNLNKYIYEIEEAAFRQSVSDLTDLLDVKELLNVQVRRLSLGERMKLELIAALIHKPKILFLDEPTIGLDIISQKKLRDSIKEYNRKEKTTIILTSHYMEDIEELCSRLIVINEGVIAYDGELDKVNELFNQKKRLNLQFSDSITRDALTNYGTIIDFDSYSATIEIDRDKQKAHLRAMLEVLPISDFNIGDIPIEEGIRLLYERGDS